MGGGLTVIWGLLCCVVTMCWATAPEILTSTTFVERGEFFAVTRVDGDTLDGVYLTGVGLQTPYAAYAVRVDSAGAPVWTRNWGNTNVMYDCIWDGAVGRMIGYTTENATHDYKVVRFSADGTANGSWDFGGNTRVDRGYSGCMFDTTYMLVAGTVIPGDSSASDGSLVLINSNGNVEWSRTYHASAIVRKVNAIGSRIWLYGTADSLSGRNRDFWMARVDSEGTIQSSRRFGGVLADELYDAERFDSSLTILVGATHVTTDSAHTDIWILATNDAGDSLWSRRFGGSENDAALCIERVMDRDSGFVVGGYWSEELLGTHNAFLLKIDQDLDSVWAQVLVDSAVAAELRDVVIDSDYRYRAAGVTTTGIPHGFYLMTDVDPAAPVQHGPEPFSLLTPASDALVVTDTIRFRWEAAIDPDPGDQVAYALVLDTDTLFDNPTNPTPIGPLFPTTYLLTRTDDVFDRYWRVVAQDQHGNLQVCDERHWHVRKIRPDSTQRFNLTGPPNGDAIPNPFATFSWETAVDPDSVDDHVIYSLFFQIGDSISPIDTIDQTSVTVNFTDHPFIHQSDTVSWWVVADSDYPQMVRPSNQVWTFINWNTSSPPRQLLPAEFAFLPAFPNPFNAEVTLRYSVAQAGNVRLDLYDVTGRLVTTLVNSSVAPGSYAVHWQGADAATGLYFARLTQDDHTATQKLLLLK